MSKSGSFRDAFLIADTIILSGFVVILAFFLAPNSVVADQAIRIPGDLLTGSGHVQRNALKREQLFQKKAAAAVDDIAFAIPADAAMPNHVFEGRLARSEKIVMAHETLRDDYHNAGEVQHWELPAMDLSFVQLGSHLIPVRQELQYTGHPKWNAIIGPGRAWNEEGDNGMTRASFPFALVERNANCVHNGTMIFLFDDVSVSSIRFQITQETCLYFKFNGWGRIDVKYVPGKVESAAKIKAAYVKELANRIPTKPISELSNDFKNASFDPSVLGQGISPEHLTSYGLLANGVHYTGPCRTRYGEYPYCDQMRLPSYSLAKSLLVGVALMRLGQKYGREVYDEPIGKYLPAKYAQDWMSVMFKDAANMTTGHYSQDKFLADESSAITTDFLLAESFESKLDATMRFPKKNGSPWVYHSTDSFILMLAMQRYLEAQGSKQDIFDLMRDEIFEPLGLSAGAQQCLRTDNSQHGLPVGGYGLFLTSDDIAKLARFLNNENGKIGTTQILDPFMLDSSLQRNEFDRGVNTTSADPLEYHNQFWAKEFNDKLDYPCNFWVPFMSGYGGITVAMLPKGMVYYYFSDNNQFYWYPTIKELGKLKSYCS